MTRKAQTRLCPECGAPVRPGKRDHSLEGTLLGAFPVDECPQRGEYSFTPSGWAAAERAVKEKGLFGILTDETSRSSSHSKGAKTQA